MNSTILLVEDNPTTRKLVRFTLATKGYSLLEAEDAASALRLAEQHPDLILQDLVLPDMDGFELAGQLRRRMGDRPVPILAFSGFVSKLEEARISAVGFDDIIVKPVEPSRLLQIIEAHLPAGDRESLAAFGGGLSLLIADDDPIQAKLAAFRFARLGFEVSVVGDGAEALREIYVNRPALVVSDVMMPKLDGFQLCLEVRKDAALRDLPIVLVTSSYFDEPDRRLALQAGANAFVVRTPDLRELIAAVRSVLDGSAPPPAPGVAPGEVEREHAQRVMQQLERQVTMNAGVAQRCALLSAELSILSRISEALTQHADFDASLDEVLAACFDAGGISTGALYTFPSPLDARARPFGKVNVWSAAELDHFFGDIGELRQLLRTSGLVALPSNDGKLAATNAALAQAGILTALAVPLTHGGELMGGLFLASKSVPLDDPDRRAFVTSVAGQLAQALALVRAFSQKVESERKAQDTAGTLRAMMESMADGVVVADLAGNCLYRNSAAEDLVGLAGIGGSAPAAPGLGVFLSDRATPYPPAQLPLVRAMHGERVQSAELFVRHEAAREGVWLSVNAMPLLDAQAERRGGVAVFRDVTAEKNAQEQLMVSDRMASIGLLAAGVAHEINNPLAVVIGNVELALEELDALALEPRDPKHLSNLRAELDDVRNAGNRVRDIARDLKLFSRAEEGKVTTEVDVRAVAESAIRLAWNEIRHRARLQKDLDDVPAVRVNESRLGQVILNLLVNAAQAIREGNAQENVIRIATERDERGDVLIAVSDTGPGIPADVLHRLFTPFFTTKPAGVGTGLGLAICRRIITSFGGDISVESRVGRGTTFRVRLPASKGTQSSRAPARPPSDAPAERASILVIDDEEAVIRAIQRVLGARHRVTGYSRAADALKTIADGARYDLIISDLVMPEMTGMDFYEELERSAPEQAERVVFLTGGAFTTRAREFLDRVEATCLDKPFNPQALRELVKARLS
jgi:CheY-like chemotaxis protein/signal transduction histidine kinase